MNKSLLAVLVSVIVLAVAFASAGADGGGWEQEVTELQNGNVTYKWSHPAGDDIRYDCRPYYGTHIITTNIYSGMWKDLKDKGVGCGMIVYYEVVYPWGKSMHTLDFEHTFAPDTGRSGIVGWRSGLDLAYSFVEYAYYGTFVWGNAAPWKPRLTWVLDVLPPTAVKFRYDPQSITFCEYWDNCP